MQDLVDAILRETGDDGMAPALAARRPWLPLLPPLRSLHLQLPPQRLRFTRVIEQPIASADTLAEILRLRGRAEPGRSHIQLYDEDEQCGRSRSANCTTARRAVAMELRRRGLDPGQTVAIMLPTAADFFCSFAGILLAGGIPVPIYPPFRADRIAEYAARQSNILRNAEVQFLLTWRQAEDLAKLLKLAGATLREVLNVEKLGRSRAADPTGPTVNGGPWSICRIMRAARILLSSVHFGLNG